MKYEDYARRVLLEDPWREFGLPRSGRVLDVGSGSGWGIAALRDLGLDAIGLDPQARHPGGVRGDASRMPFRTSSFDGVVCLRTLHHITPDREALREFGRVLRRGGFLFLTVGNALSYTFVLFRSRFTRETVSPCDPYYRPYHRRELSRLLAQAGFEITGLRACHYLPRRMARGDGSPLLDLLASADRALGTRPPTNGIGPVLMACGRRQGK